MSTDLWPDDLLKQTDESPAGLLRDQASALSNRSQGAITPKVTLLHRKGEKTRFDCDLGYQFVLVVPLMNYYEYPLFSIYYNVDLWPVRVVFTEEIGNELARPWRSGSPPQDIKIIEPDDADQPYGFLARNKEALETLLSQGFAAPRTRRIINTLMAEAGWKSQE